MGLRCGGIAPVKTDRRRWRDRARHSTALTSIVQDYRTLHNVDVLFKHFWIAFIVVTCVNAAIWRARSRPYIASKPELADGYGTLIRGWLFYGNLPWLVMGAGILSGQVPSVFGYFNPKNGPFVLAWYGTVVALWIACGYWLFVRRGAETLAMYPGLLQPPFDRPLMIKIAFLLAVAGGVFALSMMLLGAFEVPEFR